MILFFAHGEHKETTSFHPHVLRGEVTSHTHGEQDTFKPDLVCKCGKVNTVHDMLESAHLRGQPFVILRCGECGITLATQQNGDIII